MQKLSNLLLPGIYCLLDLSTSVFLIVKRVPTEGTDHLVAGDSPQANSPLTCREKHAPWDTSPLCIHESSLRIKMHWVLLGCMYNGTPWNNATPAAKVQEIAGSFRISKTHSPWMHSIRNARHSIRVYENRYVSYTILLHGMVQLIFCSQENEPWASYEKKATNWGK